MHVGTRYWYGYQTRWAVREGEGRLARRRARREWEAARGASEHPPSTLAVLVPPHPALAALVLGSAHCALAAPPRAHDGWPL